MCEFAMARWVGANKKLGLASFYANVSVSGSATSLRRLNPSRLDQFPLVNREPQHPQTENRREHDGDQRCFKSESIAG
jgi:hypothetical protein